MPMDLWHWLRRLRRFVRNLFRPRHAIVHDQLREQRDALKILLNAHGDLLTDEERARFESLANEDPDCDCQKV